MFSACLGPDSILIRIRNEAIRDENFICSVLDPDLDPSGLSGEFASVSKLKFLMNQK
jgi:hypothetical protein